MTGITVLGPATVEDEGHCMNHDTEWLWAVWHAGNSDRIGPTPGSVPPPDDLVCVHLCACRSHDHLGVVDVGPCGGWPLALAGDQLLVRTLVARPSIGPDREEEASLLRECRWEDGAIGTHQLTVVEALNLDLAVGHARSDDQSFGFDVDRSAERLLVLDPRTSCGVRRPRGRVRGSEVDPAVWTGRALQRVG